MNAQTSYSAQEIRAIVEAAHRNGVTLPPGFDTNSIPRDKLAGVMNVLKAAGVPKAQEQARIQRSQDGTAQMSQGGQGGQLPTLGQQSQQAYAQAMAQMGPALYSQQ